MLPKYRGFEVLKGVILIQDISCRTYTAQSCFSWLSAVWTAVWAVPSWFVLFITYLFQQCFPESCSANFLPRVIAYTIKDAAMFMMHTDHQHKFCHPQNAVNFSALVILQLNHLSNFHHSSHEFLSLHLCHLKNQNYECLIFLLNSISSFYLSDYTGQQIKKKKICICDEYVINLFVCIYEVRKGTLKKLLGSSFKIMLPLCYFTK
jgi:hypothetical protein